MTLSCIISEIWVVVFFCLSLLCLFCHVVCFFKIWILVVWIKLMNWIELIKRNISQKLRFFNTTCILRPCQKRPVSEICHRPIVSFRRTINAGRPKYFPVVKSPRFSTDVWRRRSSSAQTLDRKMMQNLEKNDWWQARETSPGAQLQMPLSGEINGMFPEPLFDSVTASILNFFMTINLTVLYM